MTAGTIFDNIQVTDSLAEADAFKAKYYDIMVKDEKAMFEKQESEKETARKEMEDEDDLETAAQVEDPDL